MKPLSALLGAVIIFSIVGCVTPSTVLLNNNGQGMRCATTGYGYGIAGAIAMSAAQSAHDRCVQDMEKIGYVKVPDISTGITADWKVQPPVVKMVDGTAETVGIRPDDQILQVDGKKITTMYEMLRLISTKKSGDLLKIQVKRQDEILEFTPALTSR